MIYCDASLLVTALTAERSSAQVREWLAQHSGDGFAVSLWVETELASALAQKQRQGLLTEEQRRSIFDRWRVLLADWRQVPIADRHFTGAAALTTFGLRAGDALHVAIALDEEIPLATRDRDMARVAHLLGATVHQIE